MKNLFYAKIPKQKLQFLNTETLNKYCHSTIQNKKKRKENDVRHTHIHTNNNREKYWKQFWFFG